MSEPQESGQVKRRLWMGYFLFSKYSFICLPPAVHQSNRSKRTIIIDHRDRESKFLSLFQPAFPTVPGVEMSNSNTKSTPEPRSRPTLLVYAARPARNTDHKNTTRPRALILPIKGGFAATIQRSILKHWAKWIYSALQNLMQLTAPMLPWSEQRAESDRQPYAVLNKDRWR